MTSYIIKRFIPDFDNTKSPAVRAAYGKLAGIVGIVCNLFLFAAKIIIGMLSSSVSITADAVNNLSDATSSIISLIGFKLSDKPADAEHPYGHGRYEYIAALTISAFIILIGFELLKSSVEKILHPESVSFGIPAVIVLVMSILLKAWMAGFNKKSGKKINSNTLIATSADCKNDVLTTFAILIASLVSHFTKLELDGIAGTVVAIYILIGGAKLILETLDPLLGSPPTAEYVKHISDKIMSYDGVIGMHDLMVHDYGPCRKFASVHVEMAAEDDPIDSHDIIDNIEQDFLREEKLNLIIHYDPILTKDPITNDIRKQVDLKVKEINESLSIHDLRVVPGNTHTNLVFDCVCPHGVKIEKAELKKMISQKVREINSSYNSVITIDDSFAPITE